MPSSREVTHKLATIIRKWPSGEGPRGHGNRVAGLRLRRHAPQAPLTLSSATLASRASLCLHTETGPSAPLPLMRQLRTTEQQAPGALSAPGPPPVPLPEGHAVTVGASRSSRKARRNGPMAGFLPSCLGQHLLPFFQSLFRFSESPSSRGLAGSTRHEAACAGSETTAARIGRPLRVRPRAAGFDPLICSVLRRETGINATLSACEDEGPGERTRATGGRRLASPRACPPHSPLHDTGPTASRTHVFNEFHPVLTEQLS